MTKETTNAVSTPAIETVETVTVPETPEYERTRLYTENMRELWLSQEWTFDMWIRAEDWDENEIELTDEDLAAVEKTLRGRYYINRDGQGIEFFAEDADEPALNAIIDKLAERGCAIEDCREHWEEEHADEPDTPESESKARIDDFDDKFTRICKVLETLEEICGDFDDDVADYEDNEYIARFNSFYTAQVNFAMRNLHAMSEWYDEQIETAGLLLKAE